MDKNTKKNSAGGKITEVSVQKLMSRFFRAAK